MCMFSCEICNAAISAVSLFRSLVRSSMSLRKERGPRAAASIFCHLTITIRLLPQIKRGFHEKSRIGEADRREFIEERTGEVKLWAGAMCLRRQLPKRAVSLHPITFQPALTLDSQSNIVQLI